ncbi:MAG TPA: xylulokinase [Candidatus Dormibacteraeota bacterium]|jgi:xylulokinase
MLLGLDVGITGTRALAIDESGTVRASAFVGYGIHRPRPGWTEQDPLEWWAAAQEALARVAGEVGGVGLVGGEVTAIGLSGQMSGSVFLNAAGEVIRPALLWNDQRTGPQCAEITERVGAERLIELTGNPAWTAMQAPKILWLRDVEPVQYRHVRRVLLPKDYIRLRLTGELATDVADASGSLLLDSRRRAWSAEVLDALGIPAAWLPSVSESCVIAGGLRPSVAASLGLPAGLPVAAGAGDAAAAAIATGIVRSGLISVAIGSCGMLVAHRDGFGVDGSGRVGAMCSAVPGRYLVVSLTLAAGAAWRWWRDLLGGDVDYERLGRLAESSAVGARGLFFLPYLNGGWPPHDPDGVGRGAFVGLGAHHDQGDLTRAVMEGVVFSLRDGLDAMREMGVAIERVRVSGGGARSHVWRQMLADVFGLPVETMASEEGPAVGAALVAGVAVGEYRAVTEACDRTVRTGEVIEPDAGRAARYGELLHRFRALVRATQGVASPGRTRGG